MRYVVHMTGTGTLWCCGYKFITLVDQSEPPAGVVKPYISAQVVHAAKWTTPVARRARAEFGIIPSTSHLMRVDSRDKGLNVTRVTRME